MQLRRVPTMRAKQSSTASGMYSRTGSLTSPIPVYAMTPRHCGSATKRGERSARSGQLRPRSGPDGSQDECLLHDARNLLGAIGLYCDLLSMPDVLHPEHRQYAEELRMLGTRSGTLIERLLQSSLT